MGLENRNRDFTTSTVTELHRLLDGPKETHKEFNTFWQNYGEYFDFDASATCTGLDTKMSDLRYWMSDVAPAQLAQIEEYVHEADRQYGEKCKLAADGCNDYSDAINTLADTIQKPDFSTNFDATAILAILLSNPNSSMNPRLQFIQTTMDQYGFDESTAAELWKIKKLLKAKYPNASQKELDWRYNRIISGLFYPGLDNDKAGDLSFNSTAGDAYYPLTEEEYFTVFLGMSMSTYKQLRYRLRIQHVMCSEPDFAYKDLTGQQRKTFKETMEKALGRSLTDEEFAQEWNKMYRSMYGKGDFLHQAYTTSAILATDLGKCYPPASYIPSPQREALAGWLGDASLPPYTFGGDDYRSDLDAANITNMMRTQGLSYDQASAKYYAQISGGGHPNRADIFLQNNSFPLVYEQVLRENGVSNYDDLKEKNPDAANFLENLRHHNGEMEDDT